MFEFADRPLNSARIAVVGVGGAGGNAINRMIDSGVAGVEFVSTNTDLQALSASKASQRVQIGSELTRGLGSGGDPEIGRRAIEENREDIAAILEGVDMAFITAGMGGGTGTGASPAIAEVARNSGALTVAVVTKPFDFEGPTRMAQALEGIEELKGKVDTMIVIPNQRLLGMVGKQTPIYEAFMVADEILSHATKGISDLVVVPGLINLDFADVRTIMEETGEALMGTGVGKGENRAVEAAQEAISSPLLEDLSIAGAKGILLNVTGGKDLTLFEVNEAASFINEAAGGQANVIFGAVQRTEKEDGDLRVTVIATGLGDRVRRRVERLREGDLVSYRREDMDVPPFKRKERQASQLISEQAKTDICSPDDFEIPTFLRHKVSS